MIQIISKEEGINLDVFHLVKAFYPSEEMQQEIEPMQESLVIVKKGALFFSFEEEEGSKQVLLRKLYKWLTIQTNKTLPWGILMGIRPTKLVLHQIEKKVSDKDLEKWLETEYLVSPEKIALAIQVARREHALLENIDYKNGFSLYIGIPFCPSTCSYCSFTSYSIDKYKDKVDKYLDALCLELQHIRKQTKSLPLQTVYFGGGTPTALEAEQLDRILTEVESLFPYDFVREVTVEAGRPDSITKEKLEVLKRHDVHRISINPQTMQQATLDRIGRKHSVEEVKNIFHLAREMDFDNINMDIILGLPGEGISEVEDTLRQLKELNPDSLTVHTLAIKRAAKLTQDKYEHEVKQEVLQAMIEHANKAAKELSQEPYYLYRQKNIAGSFENLGYARPNAESLYNILMMEEKQTIYGAGVGASSKYILDEPIFVPGAGNKPQQFLRRINSKDINSYIKSQFQRTKE